MSNIRRNGASPIAVKAKDSAPTYTAEEWARLIVDISGGLVTAGYIWSTQKIGTTESNPLSEQAVPEELVDTTNLTADTYYYPSEDGMSMDGYNDLSIQGVISGGVTATVEATIDDAGTPDWVDITPAGYELITNASGNASFVDTSFLLDFGNLNVSKVRVKSVTSDATNAVQYHIRRKV